MPEYLRCFITHFWLVQEFLMHMELMHIEYLNYLHLRNYGKTALV